MTAQPEIGKVIQSERKFNGLTQEQLADLAAVSERTLHAIENGTGNPTLKAVISVASVLGLKVSVTQ